ncbi:hypothetical protein JOE25_003176 [Serratia sp. PL17]|nr:hypothetical protein [Serratia sp. PL17]
MAIWHISTLQNFTLRLDRISREKPVTDQP